MTVILSLTARKALLSASTPLADREGPAVGGGERPLDRQGGGMATARHGATGKGYSCTVPG